MSNKVEFTAGLDQIDLTPTDDGMISLSVDESPVSSALDKAEDTIVLTTVGFITLLACLVIALRTKSATKKCSCQKDKIKDVQTEEIEEIIGD